MHKIHQKNKTFLFLFFTLFFNFFLFFTLYFLKFNFATIKNSGFFTNFFLIIIPLFSAIFVKNFLYKENLFSSESRKIFLNFDILNKNLFIAIYSALILEVFVFLLAFFISFLVKNMQFSTEFDLIFQKYSKIWQPNQLEILKKFSTDFSIQSFWAINAFVGILVGMTSSAMFFWLEFLGWLVFLWNECKNMTFWQKSFFIGFFRGLFYAPFVFLGYFGQTKYPVFLAFIIIGFYTLISPIICIIYKKTKSLIFPSIFSGIINSTATLATFFIIGANEIIIGFFGVFGIFTLGVANLLLYYWGILKLKLKIVKSKIKSEKIKAY